MFRHFHDGSQGKKLYEATYARISAGAANASSEEAGYMDRPVDVSGIKIKEDPFVVVHDESGATPGVIARLLLERHVWERKW
jgi:hypothetical protein